MAQDAERLKSQPSEGLPDFQHDQKIRTLQHLRLKIEQARYDFRIAPTTEKEIALRKLIQQEAELSGDVGFGHSPASMQGPEARQREERCCPHKGERLKQGMYLRCADCGEMIGAVRI
jgi:hypothetical protein